MAAAGTPEGTGDGTTGCRSDITHPAIDGFVPTGNAGANCVSTAGAFDMVGNMWEWVADISVGGIEGVTAGYAVNAAGMVFGDAYDNPSSKSLNPVYNHLPSTASVTLLDGTFTSEVDDLGLLTVNRRNGFRCVR
jgi:hypothetical protein